MTVHPITISGVPMHMYPCSRGPTNTPTTRTKRRQVKNACTNCQKACKKCDDARPCLRCVTYGLQDECVDSQRKERQKGIKRGPYKKRDGRQPASGNTEHQLEVTIDGGMVIPPAVVAGVSQPMSYVGPVGYPPTVYGQYPVAPPGKPGEAPIYYPQIYFAPFPMHAPPPPHGIAQEAEGAGYAPHPTQYYSAFLAPYPAQPYPSYIMPHPQARPEAPPPLQHAQHHVTHRYAPYPQMYARHSAVPMGDPMGAHPMDGRRDPRADYGRAGEGILGGVPRSG
ncbi:hypothetical protein OBBRIDRAFT_721069 [Obba rivulosa]|uniref:Transcription activator of gluconeogenesis ERT1 n=1 Tax=Obba rivulosa TaxID=1052685 RepID=A0A8E2J5V9_9APHY|nr:hypothetical protein OBBRIDRAFT_721069 [Obba rivulosa]